MESRDTHREVTANRLYIIIKNRIEKTCILIDVAIPADRNVMQKEAERKIIQQFMCRDIANVDHEIYDHTGNNWRYQNSNKGCKEKFGRHTRRTFNKFTTNDSYTCNITHNTESTAV
jgi:hypothetical protein